ncbi:putative RNA-binding protein 1 [Iris pallida]|uniref:RNA-binding protein 1 n=1 Tax=Iris pallida TaxID=29817 RepID=A0AAX6GT49_IRIPA|nr:putative RNA-binding protein 1 [Iris pallida]KAJ6831431.1 putative RNA-binding protein 1 [Iris pallida]
MADPYWRYAADPRQQLAMAPPSQAQLKRPRTEYPDIPPAPEMLGYYPQDTTTLDASYDRYLRNGVSFPPADPSRPIAGGLTGRPVEDAPMVGMDVRTSGYGGGRPEAPLPPDASNTLFVEGLPANCSRREVSHIFRPFVGFREVRLVSKESRLAGGDPIVLCFVDFGTPNQAAVALEALQGYRFDEHDRESANLRLQFARFPGPRSGGGPRGRR